MLFRSKDNGAWKQVQRLWIKDGGVWKSPTTALINDSGIGKQFYPDTVSTSSYTTPGSYTYTVPATVTSLSITMIAGGGSGSGGSDYGSSGGGSGGYYQNQVYAVTPGQVINLTVGGTGQNTTFGTLTCTAGSNGINSTGGGSPGGAEIGRAHV